MKSGKDKTGTGIDQRGLDRKVQALKEQAEKSVRTNALPLQSLE